MKRRWMKCGKYKMNSPPPSSSPFLPHVQILQTAQVVEYTRRELGELVMFELPFHEKNRKKRGGVKKKMEEGGKYKRETTLLPLLLILLYSIRWLRW